MFIICFRRFIDDTTLNFGSCKKDQIIILNTPEYFMSENNYMKIFKRFKVRKSRGCREYVVVLAPPLALECML